MPVFSVRLFRLCVLLGVVQSGFYVFPRILGLFPVDRDIYVFLSVCFPLSFAALLDTSSPFVIVRH